MRLGLVIAAELPPAARTARAVDADRAGVWALLLEDPPGTETVRAAALAARTSWTRLALRLRFGVEDPVTLAEEVAVLDNVSNGRVIVVADGPSPDALGLFEAALAGRMVRGVTVSPPPAQLHVPVLAGVTVVDLRNLDEAAARSSLAQCRGEIAFARWDGSCDELCRLAAPAPVVQLSRRFLDGGQSESPVA